MKSTRTTIMMLLFVFTSSLIAQEFAIPLEGFSRNKTTYLHMEDGSVKEGLLGGFKRSKGLIETVKLKSKTGKKIQIDPKRIKFMYIPPSNMAKLSAFTEKAYNVNKWDKTVNYDTTLMKDGYVYFEKVTTELKKKTEDLMLQLLNAPFSSQIKVYHDPMAGETTSFGAKGLTMAGGDDKSYYVWKKGDETAYRVKKKDYDEEFVKLFGDCKEFMEKYRDDAKWSDFAFHIYEYTMMMEK